MELGAFSVSLAVADIEASRAFYAKFGFKVVGGEVVGEDLGNSSQSLDFAMPQPPRAAATAARMGPT